MQQGGKLRIIPPNRNSSLQQFAHAEAIKSKGRIVAGSAARSQKSCRVTENRWH
jgi:hypothetical protein